LKVPDEELPECTSISSNLYGPRPICLEDVFCDQESAGDLPGLWFYDLFLAMSTNEEYSIVWHFLGGTHQGIVSIQAKISNQYILRVHSY
jgi:hypothetical protein